MRKYEHYAMTDHPNKNSDMNTQQPMMEQRLWDYIDGLSSNTEKASIQLFIEENIEWQRKYHELLRIHELMNGSELEAPSLRFSKNVMEEIARNQIAPATGTYINKNIIRGIAAFFISLIAGMLVYCLGQIRGSGGPSSNVVPNLNLDKVNNFNWSRIFNNTYTSLFMLITVVAGLMLLDAYLQRKKQQTHTTGNPR